MNGNGKHQRHGAAVLLVAVALAAVAGSRAGEAPAAAESADTAVVEATTNDRLLSSGRTFPVEPNLSTTSSPIEVLGSEQVATISPSTTSAPATAPSTTTTSTTVPPTAPPTTLPPTTLPPATLPPTTLPATTSAPAPATPQERGAQALGRISYDWNGRLPGWSITFAPGRSGVFGYTYVGEQRIEIFVRDSMSDALLAHVIAHELGHAVDVTLNNGDDRATWAAARGIEGVQWWPGDGVTDFATGAGDFAEAFAVWQVGAANYRSTAAGVPTAEQLSLLAGLASS
ncbi:MAG: hypothetical protein R2710_03720 [Acidimicrobiales bacterium]